MNSNIIKLCTAAFAGSILGIIYERLPPKTDWNGLIQTVQTVSAASSIVPRQPKHLNHDDSPHIPYKIPDVDPTKSAENLKHSAKYGLPSKDNLRIFNDFIISYDRRLRSPAWVIEHLTPEKLRDKNETDREKSKFKEDTAIHEYFRAKHNDYTGTGYDRGHMAAAGNHKNSQDDLDQTFALSNISPQKPELNRGAWERLETYVRWRAKRAKNLYVVSGPLYLPMKARDGNLYVTYRVLGNNHVSVPTHYFKVFLVEGKDDKLALEAFLMPNDSKMDGGVNLDDYRIPIDRLDIIERASGVIFFDQLFREKIEGPRALDSGFDPNRSPKRKLLNQS